MEQTKKTTFDKPACDPVIPKGYKITWKLLKYIFYAMLAYFVFKGFIAWD